MKKYLLVLALNGLTYNISSQSCTPTSYSTIENHWIKAHVSNVGDLYSDPSLSQAGFEYPKRSPQDIANGVPRKSLIFSGAIWLSSIENSNIKLSALRYRTSSGSPLHFLPGPISASNGTVDSRSCQYFDRVWTMKKTDVEAHIDKLKNSRSLPLTNIPSEILDWPGKGNKRYTTVKIEEDMAPFADVNSNQIYDPENGDYPLIKGDEAHYTVFNDVSSSRAESIGVEVQALSYVYNTPFENSIGTAIFHDYKIIKKTKGDAPEFIFGLYIDADLGNFNDDYVGCDTLSNTGFCYNADSFDEPSSQGPGYGHNPPILLTSFRNRKMNSFIYYFNATGSVPSDPQINSEYRNYMEGKNRIGDPAIHIYRTDTFESKYAFSGDLCDSNQWSMRSAKFPPQDLRYVMNTEPLQLKYNSPEEFNFVTYIHSPNSSKFCFRDSVFPKLDIVKKYPKNQDLNCKISMTANIGTDNGSKTGSIDITSLTGASSPYIVRWSSTETTDDISNKDSGHYRIVIIDANNCFKDSTFYIPYHKSGSSVQNSRILDISIYPNPFIEDVFIRNPKNIKIHTAVIFDLRGRQVFSYDNPSNQLSLKHIAKGSYLLKIKTAEGDLNFNITK